MHEPAQPRAPRKHAVPYAKGVEYAVLNDGRSRFELGWKPNDGAVSLAKRGHHDEFIKIYGSVRCAHGDFRFRDSSIMVSEALGLARFLETRPWPASERFDTLDGCLAAVANGPAGPGGGGGRHFALNIEFRGEISPPWLWGDADAVWTTGFTLEMTPDDAGLLRFAKKIREMLGIGPRTCHREPLL